MYSKSSLDHVIPFDGTNLPLWKLGLDVALEENDVTSLVDGTFLMPPEVTPFFLFFFPVSICLSNVHGNCRLVCCNQHMSNNECSRACYTKG